MPRIAVRLLLVLCLILNGIGNAMAAVAMPSMTSMSDDAVLAIMDPGAPATGDACGHAQKAPMATADPAPPSSPAGHPADCAKDCCAQGACNCPCMHLGQAALLELTMVAPSIGGTTVVTALALGHSTPALLDLIRPPIG